jgi:protein tyrosine/serine phosphatase
MGKRVHSTPLQAGALSLFLCLAAKGQEIQSEEALQSVVDGSKLAAQVKKVEDLPNFHEVHPYLFRGGQPTPAGLNKLKEMGIATIIDLRGSPEQVYNEQKAAHALGMKCINLPMSSQPPTKKQVATFIKEVERAASGKSNGPVFLHCAHGSDRTGCLVGIWRVTHDGMGYDDAYKEMRKYYFTPKFTKLSGAVKQYAEARQTASADPQSNGEARQSKP